jgi:hypothetical protein
MIKLRALYQENIQSAEQKITKSDVLRFARQSNIWLGGS